MRAWYRPKKRHAETEHVPVSFSPRNLPASTASFWSVYLVAAFENNDDYDADSDGIAPAAIGVPIPRVPSGFDYGLSPRPVGVGSTVSYIFRETIDDLFRQNSAGTDEAHTVVHELGHTAGNSSAADVHRPTGIMRAGAPSIETVFDNYYLDIFRSVDVW